MFIGTYASLHRHSSDTHLGRASGLPLAVQRFARPLTSIACHPFEPMLAVGDTAGFVHILDVTTPAKIKCRMSVRLFRDAIGALSLNDDGSLLAALSEARYSVYLLY